MANKKKLGRQTLAMLMAFVLSLSLVQMTAFAANGDGTAPAASEAPVVSGGQIQKDDSGNVLYYTSNSGGAFETTGDTEATVTNGLSNPNVTISKTIQGTSDYNTFDITLNVQTTQSVETIHTTPDAAVVLSIDTSRSMQWDASGGGYCLEGILTNDSNSGCYTVDQGNRVLTYAADAATSLGSEKGNFTFAGLAAQKLVGDYNRDHPDEEPYALGGSTDEQNAPMRITTVVNELTKNGGFLDTYVQDANGANRMLAVATFNADAISDGQWHNVSDSDEFNTVISQLNALCDVDNVAKWEHSTYPTTNEEYQKEGGGTLDSGTNIAGGLRIANNLMGVLPNSNDYEVRFTVLMTDGEPNRSIEDNGEGNSTTYIPGQKVGSYTTLSQVEASSILSTGELYGIGFGTTLSSLLTSPIYSTRCYDATEASGLASAFSGTISYLRLLADAWKVTDPMGTYMTLDTASVSGNPAVTATPGSLVWDLKSTTPVIKNTEGNVVTPEDYQAAIEQNAQFTFNYSLTYSAKLDAMHAPNEYQLTNGQTTLSYWLMDGEGNFLEANGTTVVDDVYQNPADALLTLDFKVPKVKPALTSYTVTKKWTGTGDTDATRPENGISVQLYSGGEALGDPVQLTAASGWTYTWNNLPAELAGTFSADEDEDSVPNYTELPLVTNEAASSLPQQPAWIQQCSDLTLNLPENDSGIVRVDFVAVSLTNSNENDIFGDKDFIVWTRDVLRSDTEKQALIHAINPDDSKAPGKFGSGGAGIAFSNTIFLNPYESNPYSARVKFEVNGENVTATSLGTQSVWQQVLYGPYTPAGATITNTYTPGSITITKDVTGDLSESDVAANTFSFEIKGTDTANSSVDETVTLPTTDGNWNTTVSSLPFGPYTVTETSGYVKGYQWTVKNGSDTDITTSKAQTITLSAAGTISGTVTFVNDYSLGAPVNTAEFYVHKVDASDSTGLNGAEFTLYSARTGDENTGYTYSGAVTGSPFTTATADGVDGMATITIPGTALTADSATFYLKETDAPAGYQTNDTVWTVTVTKPADNAGSPSITIDTSGTLYHKVYHWLASLTGMNTGTSSWENNTLTVEDRAISYSLTVTKTVSGAALPSEFEILVKDGDAIVATLKPAAATGVQGPDSGYTTAPYQWTVTNLSAKDYTVVEDGSSVSDYNLTVKNASGAIVSADGTNGNYTQSVTLTDEHPISSVTFENAYQHQTGTLSIGKTFTGLTEAQIQNMANTFAIHYGEATYTLNDAATSPTAGGDWTTGVTYTWNVGSVNTGTYSAYETGYAAPAGYYCTTAADSGASDHHTVSTTVTSGGTGTIAFTNAYGMSGTGSFTVEKFGTDLEADLAPYALAGATFTLYTNSDCTTAITGSDRVTSGDPATVSYAGLTDGTYYLKESSAPTGYTADPTVYQVVVSVVQSQVSVEINVLSDDNEWVSCSNDYYNAEDNVLSVYNSRDYGILRITKDVTGSLSESNFSQAAFEFTVSNAMGVSVGTFDLPYMDQGELSWTKELNLPTGEYTVTENVLTPMSGYNRNTSISYGDSATYATVVKAAYEDDIPANPALVTVTNTYSTPYTPPTGTDYTLTVQWVDENGTALADSVTRTISSGSSYDADNISGGSGRTFDGYNYNGLDTGSDAISGTMNGNKTVIFVYTGTTIITTDETPLGETPEETETAEIPEGETPLAEAPKTGDELALWILAAAASGTGLIWLTISGKKRKDEGQDG